jgi:hypothetical protein
MTTQMITDIDAQTGEQTIRPATADEISQRESMLAQVAQEEIDKKAKAAEKAALLTRLGITESEAQLLLGGN